MTLLKYSLTYSHNFDDIYLSTAKECKRET